MLRPSRLRGGLEGVFGVATALPSVVVKRAIAAIVLVIRGMVL